MNEMIKNDEKFASITNDVKLKFERFKDNLENDPKVPNIFISEILKESLNLFLNENVYIATLPIFKFEDKTYSVNDDLTIDEINNSNKKNIVYSVKFNDKILYRTQTI